MVNQLKQSFVVKLMAVITLITLILSIFFAFRYNFFNMQIAAFKEDQQKIESQAMKLEATSRFLTESVRAYAATGDEIYYSQYCDEVYNKKNRENAIYELNKIGLTPTEKDLLSAIIIATNRLIIYEELVMNDIQQKKNEEAVDVIYGKTYNMQMIKVITANNVFVSQIKDRYQNELINKDIDKNKALFAMLGTFVMSIITLMTLCIYAQKYIFVPIKKICKEINGIEKGDFVNRTSLTPNDSEIGQLTSLVYSSKNMLRVTLEDIKEVLEKISNEDYNIIIEKDYIGTFDEIKETLTKIIENGKKQY